MKKWKKYLLADVAVWAVCLGIFLTHFYVMPQPDEEAGTALEVEKLAEKLMFALPGEEKEPGEGKAPGRKKCRERKKRRERKSI